MRIVRISMCDKYFLLREIGVFNMHAEQTLKGDGKTSMIELISNLGAIQKQRIRNFLTYKSNPIKFSIKRLQFNQKKLPKSNGRKKENKLDDLVSHSKRVNTLQIEICSEKMNTLLAHRLICAADVRCLDRKSKQCLQALCLNTCLHKPNYSSLDFQLQNELQIADCRKAI